jgi:hypothetical protein
MDPLVTPEALTSFLQQDIDDSLVPAAELAVTTASGVVRRYCRQTLSMVVDDEVTLAGTWGVELTLPERPVLAVSAIGLNGLPLTLANYRWDRQGRLFWGTAALFNDDPPLSTYWGGDRSTVTVTYDHGYEVIPDEIAGVTVQVAARIFANPMGKLEQRTDGYQSTLPGVFPLELSRAEKDILNPYRRRTW